MVLFKLFFLSHRRYVKRVYLHFVLQKDACQHHLHEVCVWFQLALDHKSSVQQITLFCA